MYRSCRWRVSGLLPERLSDCRARVEVRELVQPPSTPSLHANIHRGTEAGGRWRTRFCIAQPSQPTFHPPGHTSTLAKSPKEQVCVLAESWVYLKLSGYPGDSMKALWYLLRAVKLACMILQWWIHITHLSKPIEHTTPKVSPNFGLWVIMVCPI